MSTIRNNTITASSANDVITLIDEFLNHKSREKFTTIKVAAKALKRVWAPLVFPQKWDTLVEQQKEAIAFLDCIITEHFELYESEEYLVILVDLFEQTFQCATNLEYR